jgi:hypothetical protein
MKITGQFIIVVHIAASLWITARAAWPMLRVAWMLRGVKNPLLCMSQTEARAIKWFLQNTKPDEHILWQAPTPPDPLLNYYIYPRMILTRREASTQARRDPGHAGATMLRAALAIESFEHGKVEIRRLA